MDSYEIKCSRGIVDHNHNWIPSKLFPNAFETCADKVCVAKRIKQRWVCKNHLPDKKHREVTGEEKKYFCNYPHCQNHAQFIVID